MSLNEEQTALAEQLIAATRNGDEQARDELVGLMFPVFRRHARTLLNDGPRGLTEDSVGIVSALWIKLLRSYDMHKVNDAHHLLNLAKKNMKQILVDYHRTRGREKRPQNDKREPAAALLDVQADGPSHADTLEFADALDAYAKIDPVAVDALEYMVFTGLTRKEAAAAMQMPDGELKPRLDSAKGHFGRVLGRPDDARADQ
jgi:RNA polymerase sigma factor (TIGR02999 family)